MAQKAAKSSNQRCSGEKEWTTMAAASVPKRRASITAAAVR